MENERTAAAEANPMPCSRAQDDALVTFRWFHRRLEQRVNYDCHVALVLSITDDIWLAVDLPL